MPSRRSFGYYRGLTPANDYNVDYSILGTARIEPLLRRIRNAMEGAGIYGVGQGRVQLRPHRAPRPPMPGAAREVARAEADAGAAPQELERARSIRLVARSTGYATSIRMPQGMGRKGIRKAESLPVRLESGPVAVFIARAR